MSSEKRCTANSPVGPLTRTVAAARPAASGAVHAKAEPFTDAPAGPPTSEYVSAVRSGDRPASCTETA